jgi:hypothetical protein
MEALAYFEQKKLELDIKDVRGSAEGMAELEAISGQTKTPTLKHGEFVVADFDIGEFEAALAENPQAKADLGL